jgi:choloylglycine hydrolase
MAKLVDGYPLYFDAINEHGVGCIALSFPESARYSDPRMGRLNLASYEVIQYIMARAESIGDARLILDRINVTRHAFRDELPPSPLHWFISDGERSLVLECTEDGAQVYENSVGVLSNEPTFPYHMTNLRNYLNLTHGEAVARWGEGLTPYSRGMGAIGLPGDSSSASRFVRAAFNASSAKAPDGTDGMAVARHVLGSVEQIYGTVEVGGRLEYTQYTSVADMRSLNYSVRTYAGGCATVSLGDLPLDERLPIRLPIK